MKNKAILLLALLLLIQSAYAQRHFANIEVDIDKYDTVSITGETDYPMLTEGTEDLITKTKGIRTLKIETDSDFSEYIARLNFPRGTSINKIDSAGSYR